MALGIQEENWGPAGGKQACTKHTNAAPVRFRGGYFEKHTLTVFGLLVTI